MSKVWIKVWFKMNDQKRYPMREITWFCSECNFEGTAKEYHKHKCEEWSDEE